MSYWLSKLPVSHEKMFKTRFKSHQL